MPPLTQKNEAVAFAFIVLASVFLLLGFVDQESQQIMSGIDTGISGQR